MGPVANSALFFGATLVRILSVPVNEGAQSDIPYKGLLPYGLNKTEIFYGRRKAKKDLLTCLKQGPLTVLHAESGGGKTSLLQAGAAAQLIASGHLAVYARAHDKNPLDFIKRMFLPDVAAASLREFLRQVYAVLGPKATLYLLLDQLKNSMIYLKKLNASHFSSR